MRTSIEHAESEIVASDSYRMLTRKSMQFSSRCVRILLWNRNTFTILQERRYKSNQAQIKERNGIEKTIAKNDFHAKRRPPCGRRLPKSL